MRQQVDKQTTKQQRRNRLWEKQFFRYTTDYTFPRLFVEQKPLEPFNHLKGHIGYWYNDQNNFPPNYENKKSAGIETALKQLKDTFCNSFKRK